MQNLRFSSPNVKPQLIITPHTESEVQASVICCKQHNIQIRVRSRGHDYEGLSYAPTTPFVIMGLMNLTRINIDTVDYTAWVEGGATLGEVYYRIAEKSSIHGFPAGVCSTVGVGGHIAGGGFGMMSRKFGLAADHVIDARVVDVNGRVLNGDSMGEDLFWAIRGGGASSFGVITAWKVSLVSVPQLVTVFTVSRSTTKEAIQLVGRWQYIAHQLHDDLFIRVIFEANQGENRERAIKVVFNSLFLGPVEELIPGMNEKFPELSLKDTDCKEMTWIESVLYFNWFPPNSPIEVLLDRKSREKTYFKGKSDFVEKLIPERVWSGLWDRILQQEIAFVILDPHGGKMSGRLEGDLPFPHRNGSLFNVQYLLKWNKEEEGPSKMEWLRDLYEFMGPHVSQNPRSAYINYRDLDLGINLEEKGGYEEAKVWGDRYLKGNFMRLAAVKGRVDPSNFFRNEQSIPPLLLRRKSESLSQCCNSHFRSV
ncbi:Cannabidiolic acid synthase-like 1 [Nymphaea thermarum]|nr:Cannabidiolic acid synthase-like 1 [Nymphaea thermarum]